MKLVAQLSLMAFGASLLLGASAVQAQQRSINLPDTLGANFDIADSAHARATASDFDYLLGAWEFTFQGRKQDGGWNPAFSGHWTAEKRSQDQQGVLFEDHWRADHPGEAASTGTYTYRAFNAQGPLWQCQGIDTENGQWAPGIAWSDGTNRYMVQHYGTAIMRIRYFAITPQSFLWRADLSVDGGRTWQRDRWTMEAHRIAGP